MESDLNLIQLDPPRRPLLLDRMFDRATQWGTPACAPASSARAPSPVRRPPVFPLPLPLSGAQSSLGAPSPLAQLFEYAELVPCVLEWFDRPAELAALARVSQAWHGLVRRKLYADIWLVTLFRTLVDRPELRALVKRLDIRFFPLDLAGEARYDLEMAMQCALSQMHNLERVVWTRDRSLTAALFETLVALPRVRALELSGHSARHFDPLLLGGMPALAELRIMMPDAAFRDALVSIVARLAARPPVRRAGEQPDAPAPPPGLCVLDIICRSSPLVDDALLAALAPSLAGLARLTLIGCTRLTHRGVDAVLAAASGLEELNLDATPHSGLHDLSHVPPFVRLRTLSLTFTAAGTEPVPLPAVPLLPPLPELTAFDLTLSGNKRFLPLPTLEFLLASVPAHSLTRVSLLNLVLGTDSLNVLLALPKLAELYVSVNHKRTVLDANVGDALRVLHVNAPEQWGPTIDDLCEIARRAKGIEEIGALNRVYEVHRRWQGDEHVVELARWSKVQVPGYFQVWRA
ncbi:hypothetical protein Q5752_002217 [Cryptotrichosporon argae]